MTVTSNVPAYVSVVREWALRHAPGIGALAAMLVVIFAVHATTGFASLQDFGEWVYQGRVLSDLWRGVDHGVALVAPYPVPYVTHLVLVAACMLAAGPIAGPLIALTLFAALGAVAIDLVVRRYGLRPVTATIVLTGLVIGSGFYNGYLGAQFGFVLVLLYLGLPRGIATRWWVLLGFSLATFATHALGFAAWGLTALVFAVAARRLWMFALTIAPSLALTAWYALSSLQGRGSASYSGFVEWFTYNGYTIAKLGGYQNLIARANGDAELASPLYFAGIGANALFAVAALTLVIWLFVRGRSLWRTNRVELVIGGTLVIVALALPSYFIGIVNPGERLLVPALAVFSLIWFRRSDAPARLGTALAAVMVLGAVLTVASLALVPLKLANGSELSAAPSGGTDRSDALFGHRLDQFEDKLRESQQPSPSMPLAWYTSILVEPVTELVPAESSGLSG